MTPPDPAEVRYRSRQFGAVTVWALAVAAVACALGAVPFAAAGVWFAAATMGWGAAVCVALLPFVWDLTITLTGEELRWRLGPGPLGRAVPLHEIDHVAPARVGPSGWGVQWMPGGWSYVVTGTTSVDLTLRSGRLYRLGTPDPEGLTAAVRAATSTIGRR